MLSSFVIAPKASFYLCCIDHTGFNIFIIHRLVSRWNFDGAYSRKKKKFLLQLLQNWILQQWRINKWNFRLAFVVVEKRKEVEKKNHLQDVKKRAQTALYARSLLDARARDAFRKSSLASKNRNRQQLIMQFLRHFIESPRVCVTQFHLNCFFHSFQLNLTGCLLELTVWKVTQWLSNWLAICRACVRHDDDKSAPDVMVSWYFSVSFETLAHRASHDKKKKSTRKHWKRNKTQHNYAGWGGRAMNAWSGCYVSGRLDENTTRPARWKRRITCAMRAHASKYAGVKFERRGQNTYHKRNHFYLRKKRKESQLHWWTPRSLRWQALKYCRQVIPVLLQRQPCMQIKCSWSRFGAS